MKQTLETQKVRAGNVVLHIAKHPAFETAELPAERILCNNVIFPTEFNPHNVRLWVVGNEFGPLGAVWADCEQDALDELVDAGLGDGLLIDEADADEDSARLGNAGEPAALDYAWLYPVDLSPSRWQLLVMLAEARGANYDNMGQL